MRRDLSLVFALILSTGSSAGCGAKAPAPQASIHPVRAEAAPPQAMPVSVSARADDAALAADSDRPIAASPTTAPSFGSWIGASAESEVLPTTLRDAVLGVWVDVPEARPERRPPAEVLFVVDTSGSMAGPKIDNARRAAQSLVRQLHDGDIVALCTFSDAARTLVSPTLLHADSRMAMFRSIASLREGGSTNMYDGLQLAESYISSAPSTHPLRRIVVISDGRANVGPQTPEALGALAERGLRARAQVTSLGVGNDYDESTLNALAVRSSGRLYHLSDPREMESILQSELAMLDATRASDAFIEIVPAPGVALLGTEGFRSEYREGTLRIPLGALHAGQHREALVRVRITDARTFETASRPLASVRLRFHDTQDNDLERVHEVVARARLSSDPRLVSQSENARTKAIASILDASKKQLAAAQHVNQGQFADADRELERAQSALAQQAQTVTSAPEKKRLEAAAGRIAPTRAAARAMPAAPKATQRDGALKMNADAMHEAGY